MSTYLLSQSEDLEALKVGQVLPPLGALSVLRVVALSPLAIDLVLLPQLLDGTSAGSTGELGDNEVGEGSVGERKDVTGDDLLLFGGGTVNQDLSLRTVNIVSCTSCTAFPAILHVSSHAGVDFVEKVTYTAVVNDLDNSGQLAGVRTTADEDQTANLNQLPLSKRDIDFGHGDGLPVCQKTPNQRLAQNDSMPA